jgi:hypothetical protein
MGSKQVLSAPRSPWQYAYVERMIGTIRREWCSTRPACAGIFRHSSVIVTARLTHLALDNDAPDTRSVQLPDAGRIISIPEVGGLHHRYERRAA